MIETANFNEERRWIPLGGVGGGVFTTAHMTLVERFPRLDGDTLEYTFTVTDLDTWTAPWSLSMPMRRTDQPIFEYACHEGNYSMTNILGGKRMEELAAGRER